MKIITEKNYKNFTIYNPNTKKWDCKKPDKYLLGIDDFRNDEHFGNFKGSEVIIPSHSMLDNEKYPDAAKSIVCMPGIRLKNLNRDLECAGRNFKIIKPIKAQVITMQHLAIIQDDLRYIHGDIIDLKYNYIIKPILDKKAYEKVDLSYNLIENLESLMGCNFEKLDLSNNKIKDYKQLDYINFDNLQEFYVSKNPFLNYLDDRDFVMLEKDENGEYIVTNLFPYKRYKTKDFNLYVELEQET